MSQKQPEQEEQDSISWEEAVFRYLEDNPEYFRHNSEILAGLEIPHPETGEAISLIERQVQVLRGKHQDLSQQLAELVQFARENERLVNRLHHFSLAAVSSRSLNTLIEQARNILMREFDLDAVSIMVCKQEVEGIEDYGLKEFIDELFLANGDEAQPICGNQYTQEILTYLFDEQSENIRSCALVPLGEKAEWGLLALGSVAPERFQSQMGTVYLDKLGDLLSAGVKRHLETVPA
jgi:uncharacterized protein